MTYSLWDYQAAMVDQARAAYADGHRGVFLQARTGAGKTVMFCHIIESAERRGTRVLLLAHLRELLWQAREKLAANGIRHGLIAAGYANPAPLAPVQLGMVHTVRARADLLPPGLIIVDEAHLAMAPTYRRLCLERWPAARRLLVSATPWRLDGQGFRDLVGEIVSGPSYATLVDAGRLVPMRHFSSPVDLAGLPVSGGEFDPAAMGEMYRRPKLVGDVVDHYCRYAAGRRAIVFGCNVAHSRTLTEAFAARGIRAAHLDGESPQEERDAANAGLRSGRYDVLCNCGLFTQGWDCPEVSAVVVARATLSLSLWLQMAGRGTRPSTGKTDCLVLDHGRNVERHGLVTREIPWSLDGEPVRPKEGETVAGLAQCLECFMFFEPRLQACPHCGAVRIRRHPLPQAEDGELREVTEAAFDDRLGLRITDMGLWVAVNAERTARGLPIAWVFGEYRRRRDAANRAKLRNRDGSLARPAAHLRAAS